MILDAQNVFSNLSTGDEPGPVGDTASGSVIDQSIKDGLFVEGGQANEALWIIVRVLTAFTSAGASTIQAVVQDSLDNVTYADLVLGPVNTLASAIIGFDLLNIRLPSGVSGPRRYIRVVYRIATAAMTGGKVLAFLTPDRDFHDLSQRKTTTTVAMPVGALYEATPNGIFGS